MKKLTKLIGLKKTEFDEYINSKDPKIKSQINVRPARLIPVLKTGDEMALSSIFLASLRLIKEFRDTIFKEIKFSRNGKLFYYTSDIPIIFFMMTEIYICLRFYTTH